jgi:ornithine cyclodeaminase/alanine dehydrogenase-like protein (mu-crystallin family)
VLPGCRGAVELLERHVVTTPPIRYLAAVDVVACMPVLDERIRLAERTLVGLAEGAELPAKIGVHPRPEDSFVHAMPALLRGAANDGSADLVGVKWIAGFPANGRLGLPALHGLVVVNDPLTGIPLAILDGGPITSQRTAAVSGVAIGRWCPPIAGRAPRAAIIGAGAQGHAHAPVLGALLPGVELAVHDRLPGRAAALAATAAGTAGVGAARAVADPGVAVADADVVVTCVSFGPVRQVMDGSWFTPDALVVAVDYATSVAADVALGATLFLTDHRGQLSAGRDAGLFDGYPDPDATLGEAILASTPRPSSGRVLVTHLGVGLADLVFADAILHAAEARGIGTLLPR